MMGLHLTLKMMMMTTLLQMMTMAMTAMK